MLSPAALDALIAYRDDRRIRFISDEIYHGITYDERAESALASSDTVIVINSFSKYYCMTGWRLGWDDRPGGSAAPQPKSWRRTSTSHRRRCPNMPPCRLSIAATSSMPTWSDTRAIVRICWRRCRRSGFTRMAPADGAFYLYADVGNLTNDSADFCRRMLEETGVAVTPGVDFDTEAGQRYLRF